MTNGTTNGTRDGGFTLESLGWDEDWAEAYQPHRKTGLLVGRIANAHRKGYVIYAEAGELSAKLLGKLRKRAMAGDLSCAPAVGDWVAYEPKADQGAMIRAVLPRRSLFARKHPGKNIDAQVLAANIDYALIVTALDRDLNPRRIERFLSMVLSHQSTPVLVLSKADLAEDLDEKLEAIAAVAQGIDVVRISALHGDGVDALEPYLSTGHTAALLGTSGVGKSTLVNRLVGEQVMKTQNLRAGLEKGRHTTTARHLILLPQGGTIIDSPGIRELEPWDAADGIEATFDDITALAELCRFGDCSHQHEPGCAVLAAVEAGDVGADRLEAYLALSQEARDQRGKLIKLGDSGRYMKKR